MSKKTSESQTEETQSVEEAQAAQTPKKARRMGVVYFLQLHEQNRYIQAQMRAKYASTIMTEDEWLIAVENLKKERVRG